MRAAFVGLVVMVGVAVAGIDAQGDLLARARALHKQVPVIDGHNDYPWAVREKAGRDLSKLDISGSQPQTHTDIPRLRQGGVGAQFWSVYVPATLAGQTAVTATLEEIDTVYEMLARYPKDFELALTANDVERGSSRLARLLRSLAWRAATPSTRRSGTLRLLYSWACAT